MKVNDQYVKNKIQQYYKNKAKNKFLINHYYDKRKEDIVYRIIDNLSKRATNCLKKEKFERNLTHMQLIGCDKDTLKEHLSKQFTDEMNFDNYGDWEVDHVKPISLYDMCKIEDILKCFNYKNLQPLWSEDNKKKYNKYL